MNNALKTLFETDIASDSTARKLIGLLLHHGAMPIADVARELGLSVPTTTKILRGMKADGILTTDTNGREAGGRSAVHYGINAQLGYFIGIDVKYNRINFTLTDFATNPLQTHTTTGFQLWNNPNALTELYTHIRDFLSGLTIENECILGLSVCLPGRINTATGRTYTIFQNEEKPLAQLMSDELGFDVRIDNDTRCMAYGEYLLGPYQGAPNVVFANIGWGIGTGLIIDRHIYYGKSGFSGEYGHAPAFDNEQICICGKKGCLETEVSGSAIVRKFRKRLEEGSGSILQQQFASPSDIELRHILQAARDGDNLAIEVIQNVGYLLGKHLATLLNLFNPDYMILGGSVGRIGDCLTYAVRNSLMKYALSYVASDSQIATATLDENLASTLGACLLMRNSMLGLI